MILLQVNSEQPKMAPLIRGKNEWIGTNWGSGLLSLADVWISRLDSLHRSGTEQGNVLALALPNQSPRPQLHHRLSQRVQGDGHILLLLDPRSQHLRHRRVDVNAARRGDAEEVEACLKSLKMSAESWLDGEYGEGMRWLIKAEKDWTKADGYCLEGWQNWVLELPER